MTRSCARGTPPSSRLSPLCAAPREPLQRRYFGETRRSGDEYNDLRELHRLPHTRIYFWIFSWPFRGTFYEVSTNLPWRSQK